MNTLLAMVSCVVLLTAPFKLAAQRSSEVLRVLYSDLFQGEDVKPSFQVFSHAIHGMDELEREGKCATPILTIVDFTKPSTAKRLWVIDVNGQEMRYNTLVAHGKNSGGNVAKVFSNRPQSYMSSLGFYVTGSTYHGKHGLSLYLNGQELGINDKAKERAIVMHGADYVSQSFIKKVGRLGRSHGCPAVPMHVHKELIEALADGTCLFVWYPDVNYLKRSRLLDKDLL
ncbi:MAG: murein L,D-transpeptidase catalytic domain family protein [Cryomorphaceae bacterium]